MNPETRALLRNHLMYNAYPPPRNMDGVMEACEKAIDHINSGDYNEIICKVNGEDTSASQIADDWRLWDPAFMTKEVLQG
jgi:hypothetical protein